MANIDPRLREICLGLPEAVEEVVGACGQHAKYLVRGRVFTRFHDSHHGDGVVGIICKAPSGVQAMLVASDSKCFFVPSYSGHLGDIGLRLDVGVTDWELVRDLVTESYRMVAPKKLLAIL